MEYTWAILYLVGCKERPFAKTPVVPDTVLAAPAVVGLTDEDRMKNFNGTVAHNTIAQYKVFMFCGPQFFAHLDAIVDITNSYYDYLRTALVVHDVDRETAYALCASVFAPVTQHDSALRALLTRHEIKYITKSAADPIDIPPIRFNPHPVYEDSVMRYIYTHKYTLSDP